MNAEEFVDAIREVVVNSAVRSVQSNLFRPPGRDPDRKLATMSDWYNKLGDGDKNMVIRIVEEAARTGVFGFFCVLDGVRAIENGDKGELKLYHEKGDERVLLNDSNTILHDLL